ncbi:RNA polymerase subunit sigma-70 [Sanguibacter antarcticus]|uniref:RNA polymerase ECF family sigma subunit n=1 Tax=Sanguibacter antarcticus TaxID=372484 RepID=A0A2A9E399_9MICO|nr:RNA polymerase subunit sigma-70 [Sanguibacter antarcticus]PFG33051.1 RNA polymerase ECF family sigma subunit [Sanguibacter antarcticus]
MSSEELEAYRRPLTGYCYRLLGSAADADDAVQETLIRASRKLADFDPQRARLTTWLHTIATNICIDMLRSASRRALAVDLGPASQSTEMGAPLSPGRFVEPMPDARLFGIDDPADRIVLRETVRLAFIAALQRLSPRQRATLVLRDVLVFSAQESAEILGTSVAAVNSVLQRARAALADHPVAVTDVLDPEDAVQRDLLARYVAAFEAHDVPRLTALLREDATSSMPPFAWWLSGRDRIGAVMAASDACAGDRLLPTAINGSPGFGQYRPGLDGRLEPFALLVVEVVSGRVAHLVTFLGSQARFAEFGLPPVVKETGLAR